jgi:hypothetical protein
MMLISICAGYSRRVGDTCLFFFELFVYINAVNKKVFVLIIKKSTVIVSLLDRLRYV